jgi:hypothetical protein
MFREHRKPQCGDCSNGQITSVQVESNTLDRVVSCSPCCSNPTKRNIGSAGKVSVRPAAGSRPVCRVRMEPPEAVILPQNRKSGFRRLHGLDGSDKLSSRSTRRTNDSPRNFPGVNCRSRGEPGGVRVLYTSHVYIYRSSSIHRNDTSTPSPFACASWSQHLNTIVHPTYTPTSWRTVPLDANHQSRQSAMPMCCIPIVRRQQSKAAG